MTTAEQAHEFVKAANYPNCTFVLSELPMQLCHQPKAAAIHRLVTDAPADNSLDDVMHPDGTMRSCFALTDSEDDASEPQAAPPELEPLTVDECLRDLQAWIRFALNGEIKSRAGTIAPTFTDGYSYVEIPEWSVRQKLDNITTTLDTRTSTASALAEKAEARYATAMRALESLTPSGSEFVNDPERCAAFVRDVRGQQHRIIIDFKRKRDAAEAKATALAEALRDAAENNHSFHAINGNGDRIQLIECEVEACTAARTALARYEGKGE